MVFDDLPLELLPSIAEDFKGALDLRWVGFYAIFVLGDIIAHHE
jgi:hypothetical protein